MNKKSINEHLEDGTFRADRHEDRKKNYSAFDSLESLPRYTGDLLNEIGKRFYKRVGNQLIAEKILSPLDLPIIEQAAYYYQGLCRIIELCGGDVERYMIEMRLSTQAAFISQQRFYLRELNKILSDFGATPMKREDIRKPEPEEGETGNPFFKLVNNG